MSRKNRKRRRNSNQKNNTEESSTNSNLEKEISEKELKLQELRKIDISQEIKSSLSKNIEVSKADISDKKEKSEKLRAEKSQILDEPKQQTKLTQNISRSTKDIERVEKEIEDSYTKFEYKPNRSELSNLKSSKTQEYRIPDIPKFALPEIGTLFETKENYFLEIVDYDDLQKANELKQRYTNKQYKVVVGGNYE